MNQIHDCLDQLESVIKESSRGGESLEEALEKIEGAHSIEESLDYLTGLAFTLTSLTFAQLKLSGTDVGTHKIRNEIERVKKYMKSVEDRRQKIDTTESIEHPLPGKRKLL
jgi:hypothetical protein